MGLLMLMDVCGALRYLHGQSPSIVHGDLKGRNVLVEKWAERPHCKLIDFGLSRFKTRHTKALGGTLRWMAPEVIAQPSATVASSADVFSFGRLIYLVMTGKMPLFNLQNARIEKLAARGIVPELSWPPRDCSETPDNKFIGERTCNLCSHCLQIGKNERAADVRHSSGACHLSGPCYPCGCQLLW